MAKADTKGTKLKIKKIKGRVMLLKAIMYKKSMIYIRLINTDIFMYDLVFEGQIYSSYLVITPAVGKTKLSEDEIRQSSNLILAGAMTTIDMLLGVALDSKVEKQAKEVVKVTEGILNA